MPEGKLKQTAAKGGRKSSLVAAKLPKLVALDKALKTKPSNLYPL